MTVGPFALLEELEETNDENMEMPAGSKAP